MAHLNHAAGRFQLCELEEGDGSIENKEVTPQPDLESHLQQRPNIQHVQAQFAEAIGKVKALAPAAEIAVVSPAEISFRVNGLEFARAPFGVKPGTFKTAQEIVFGAAGMEAILAPENEAAFQELVQRIAASRQADADNRDPLWRIYPERWLESLLVNNIAKLDLDPAHVYSQVPAFSSADRSLIDVLGCTRAGRLAVLELKADEDIHLPIQGLDYWARVLWHHNRAEFQQHGYFTGVQLSPQPPLLILVAPSLRVHPAVDVLLRYFSPAIEWALVGVDERWREGISVIYRKSAAKRTSV